MPLTDLVKVEWIFAWDGTIETSFQIGGPVVHQDILPTGVSFANSSYPGVDILPAVHVLHSGLPEEEVNVFANVIRSNEIRF